MSPSDKALLTVLAVFAILVWLLPMIAGIYMEEQERKKRGEPDNSKAQYDERQKLIRLEAGTHAFYTLIAYLLIWLVLEFADVLHWEARTVTLLAIGPMLAMLVWNGECILRGAMLGFNQQKNEASQITAYFAVGACWTLIGCVNLAAMSAPLGTLQILMGGSYLIMGVLMLYARRKRRQAERRPDTGDGET